MEIAIGRENGPAMAVGGGADQEIDCRSGNTSSAAAFVHVGGFFVVLGFEWMLREGPQVVAQFAKLRFLFRRRSRL